MLVQLLISVSLFRSPQVTQIRKLQKIENMNELRSDKI